MYAMAMEGDTNQGEGKPSPYPMTQGQAQTSRVRAGLAPALAHHSTVCVIRNRVYRMVYAGSYAIPRLVSATIKATTSSMRAFSLSGLLPGVRVDPPHRLTRGLFHNGRHAKTGVAASTCESCSSGCAFSPSFFCTVGSRALEYEYMRAKRRAVVMRAIHYEGDF